MFTLSPSVCLKRAARRRHRALRRGLGALGAFGNRDHVEGGGAPCVTEWKGLPLIAERRPHPEGVDRVGQHQHFDAAPGEALELRAARGSSLRSSPRA